MSQEFAHLHNHTHFSLLDGACSVGDLVGAAQACDMKSVALTDHGVMFGAIDFYKKAKKAGIKPILGCEMYVVSQGVMGDRVTHDVDGKKKHYNHLILLAQNEIGYRNLIKLVTLGHTDGFYYKPRVDLEALAAHNEGLIALSACAGGVVSSHLVRKDYNTAKSVAQAYKEIFPGRFYLEIQDHGLEAEKLVLEGAPRIARELDLPLICTNDCHYIRQEHAIGHNVLLNIKDVTGSSGGVDVTKLRYQSDQMFFRTAAEMQSLFKRFPEAIENTLRVAEMCNVEFKHEFHMPRFPIPVEAGVNTLEEYLVKLTNDGLDRRYKNITKDILDRSEFELGVINKMGFAGYFLIVQDFIRAARGMGISVGPGRGSAAGSLVAFALGITNVDPLRYNLLFERFLNPERVSMPDIDIDFSDNRREDVITYVREKYGAESVAQIITFGTLSSRAVLKDVGRVLGVPLSMIESITKYIPVILGRITSLKEAIDTVPELRWVKESTDPKIKDLIRYSLQLEGFCRNASKHAAGVVIAPGPVSDYVPLYKTPQIDEPMTQYSMKDIEEAGLLKMDFLGLRTLSIIDTTLALIEERHAVKINIDEIPLDDKKVYELFSRGATLAVFQFDSPPMQEYMRKLKPTCIEDLSAMNALYRPGPMKYIDEFIARKHGTLKIEYLHPQLEPILKETYGVIVTQEQVMRICRDLAGFSLAKADIVRKAMGKKDKDLINTLGVEFVEGAIAHGIEKKIAVDLYKRMAEFGDYGFNASHALAYSLIAYQTAYLKTHYTAEFLAANMTHEMGDTDYIVQLIDEARKFTIKVLPPDVSESGVGFIVTNDGIRFGLAAIKGVGAKAVESILQARKTDGKFLSLCDFVMRVDTRLANKRTLEGLVAAGAFDTLLPHRSSLFNFIEKALGFGSRTGAKEEVHSLFGAEHHRSVIKEPLMPMLPEWTEKETLTKEKEVLGFYVSGHPLEPFRMDVLSFSTMKYHNASALTDGATIRQCGIITNFKTKVDKRGNTFATMMLEDFWGKCECIFWSREFDGVRDVIKDDVMVMISGRAEVSGDAVKIIATDAIPLERVRHQLTKCIELVITDDGTAITTIDQLKNILATHTGSTATVVTLASEKGNRTLGLPKYPIHASNECLNTLAQLIGEENIFLH